MDYTIADRLAELRRAQGLSQESLAAKLGLTRQAVSRWERGESLPDTENLIALADLYGVTLDELVRPRVEVEAQEAAGGSGEPEAAAEPEEAADEPEAASVLEDSAAGAAGFHELADAPQAVAAGQYDASSPARQTEELPASEEVADDEEPPRAPDSAWTPPAPDIAYGATGTPHQESHAYRAGGCLAKALVGCLIVSILGAALTAGGCVLFRWHTIDVSTEYPATVVEEDPDGSTQWSSPNEAGEVFVDAGQVEGLSIDWAAGPAKVMVVSDEEIGPGVLVSEEYLSDSEQDCPMQVKVEHGTLVISYGKEGQWRTNVGKGKRLTVRIPATLARQLQGVSCELAGGSLELGDLTCQTLDLELAGGTMDVRDVVARDLDVEVAAGEADVRGSFAGAVDMELSAGSVRVSSGVVPTTTDIDVSLGKAVLELPSDASFKANVDKAAGTFELDFEATRKGDTYIVGSGGDAIDVDIAGGSVRIRER